jgi:RNA polymerase sigma factor (sigma-70 family)
MNLEEEYDEEVAALYRKWVGSVQGFLVGMGCDRGLAEEITDDAFLGARRHWVRVRTYDAPEGYVFKIARNERSRRQMLHNDRVEGLHPDPPRMLQDFSNDPAQEIADREVIQQALQRLPCSLREAVTLRDVAGLSEAAAAEIMGVSVGSVKRYTSDGRGRLRSLLAVFRPRRGGMTDDCG